MIGYNMTYLSHKAAHFGDIKVENLKTKLMSFEQTVRLEIFIGA
jgi:hypothetical protein